MRDLTEEYYLSRVDLDSTENDWTDDEQDDEGNIPVPLSEMHPEEKLLLENYVGRPLTNEQAHKVLHDAMLVAAFNSWLQDKES